MPRTIFLTAGICFFLFLFLAGCTPQDGNGNGSSSSSTSSSVSSRPRAERGEFCGGIGGILCVEGLECEYEGTYPDAGGTCVDE